MEATGACTAMPPRPGIRGAPMASAHGAQLVLRDSSSLRDTGLSCCPLAGAQSTLSATALGVTERRALSPQPSCGNKNTQTRCHWFGTHSPLPFTHHYHYKVHRADRLETEEFLKFHSMEPIVTYSVTNIHQLLKDSS